MYKNKLKDRVASVSIIVSMGCDRNFYGADCSVVCVEDEYWLCARDGQVVCRKGKDCNMREKKSD